MVITSLPAMISSNITFGLTALIVLYSLYKHFTRSSLAMVRGPKSSSFIFGNLLELFQRPVGEVEFAWQSQYGNIIRFKSVFGEDQLLISDPKALQKILNLSGYNYSKLPALRVISEMMNGKGIIWSDGDIHKRQRSIMLPGFGLKECKPFLSIFKDSAESISTNWLHSIGNGDGRSMVIDVRSWLSRGTLDAIGHALFDIQFETVRDDSHPLVKAYKNFFGDVFGLPSKMQIFTQAAAKYIPTWILQWIANHSRNPRLVRVRNARIATTKVARELVREKTDALLQGKGSRDVFTLLIKANMDADAKYKLTDEELLAQMRTLLMAGHEATANTVGWILLEIARNPGVQSKLRDEIMRTKAIIQTRNDPQMTLADLDGMPYLNAVIKEGLRFHPVAPHIHRRACKDDIVPLATPIVTVSGKTISEVPIAKGTQILISVAAYNRNKDLWGEDVHDFRPDRWLDGTLNRQKSTNVGVYSNLLTFLSGPRACLAWRFALIEIQAFLWELIGKFEFGMTDKAERIVRQPAIGMMPMVDGERGRVVQFPLLVSLTPDDGI